MNWIGAVVSARRLAFEDMHEFWQCRLACSLACLRVKCSWGDLLSVNSLVFVVFCLPLRGRGAWIAWSALLAYRWHGGTLAKLE